MTRLLTVLLLAGCGSTPTEPVACPPAPEPHPIAFINGTSALGITATHHYATEFCQLADTVGGPGVCTFDYDEDGDLDIYFVDRAPHRNTLYRNDGPVFTDVSAAAGADSIADSMGCLAFDQDSDGDLDLYLTNNGPDQLLRNEGGKFVDATADLGLDVDGLSISASAGDIDGDGDLDLFVGRLVKLDSCPDECSLPPAACDADSNVLLENHGSSFSDVSAARGISHEDPTLAALFVDFDRDGDLDLYAGNDMGIYFPDRMYINDGTGTFSERAFDLGIDVPGSDTMGVDIGDFDLDGQSDFVMSDFRDRPIRLLRCFDPALPCSNEVVPDGLDYVKWGIGFVDFDQDGALDLFAAAGEVTTDFGTLDPNNPHYLYWGNGLGGFRRHLPDPGEALDARGTSRGVAFGDLDGDGDVDVVVANAGGPHQVLLNQSPLGHSITVELDSLAAGALVTMHTDRSTLTEHAVIGGSYAGSSDPRVHFGLGSACRADITVRYLDGAEQVVGASAGDRVVLGRPQ